MCLALLFDTMSMKSICGFEHLIISSVFCGFVVLHCVNKPKFMYLFSYLEPFGLFLVRGFFD